MITLCGFAISNYYNKCKLILLEKDIPFHEEPIAPSQEESMLQRSPLGKIPFIETDHGCLSESQVILEYLEDAYPGKALYPADPFARAKCRELIQHLELNVELIARRIYGEAFFGAALADEVKDEVKSKVESGLQGFTRLVRFSPYIAGAAYTAADCVAWVHFGTISLACQRIYGEDLIASRVPGVAAYLSLVGQRPQVQRVAADRIAAMESFFNRR
jgi:glutathione S-transferase